MWGIEHKLYKLDVNDKELLKLYGANTPNSKFVNSFKFCACNNSCVVDVVIWYERLEHPHFSIV